MVCHGRPVICLDPAEPDGAVSGRAGRRIKARPSHVAETQAAEVCGGGRRSERPGRAGQLAQVHAGCCSIALRSCSATPPLPPPTPLTPSQWDSTPPPPPTPYPRRLGRSVLPCRRFLQGLP
jgi:hypothetical protein